MRQGVETAVRSGGRLRAPGPPVRGRRGHGRLSEAIVYGALLTPYGLVMTAFAIAALLFGIVLSVFNIDLIAPSPLQFVKAANFLVAFGDPTFRSSLELSIYFLVVPVIIQVAIGLIAALALQSWRSSSAVQAVILVPMFVPPVTSGLFWKLIMTPGLGGLDSLLSALGLPSPDWLTHSGPALAAVTIADVWEWFPFAFVFLLAALKGVPQEPYEAARVDGASEFQIFRRITLPLLRIPLATASLLELVNALFLLPLIYTLTGGGPGQATEPLDYYAFVQGFQYFNLSYAATLLIILMAIVLIPSIFLVARIRRTVNT